MATLVLNADQRDLLWRHLLPSPHELEEAAFLFVRQDPADPTRLICEDVRLLGPEDLVVQLPYHIELAEHVRPQLIKRAHDTGQILLEAHSHLGNRPVRFSDSDLFGFDEWVPHIRWRLKGRPYAAIVVSEGSYDGFAWMDITPERLDVIEVVGEGGMIATSLSSFQNTEVEDHE